MKNIEKKYRSNIPDGMKIFMTDVYVAGLNHHDGTKKLLKLAKRPHPSLFFKSEPENKHDCNAIAIYAAGIGSKIGYIPKDTAELISKNNVNISGSRITRIAVTPDFTGLYFDIFIDKKVDLSNDILVPCPFCSEQIKANAIKCKHCGEFLDGSKVSHNNELVVNLDNQTATPIKNDRAKIIKKSSSFGSGCIFQLLGLGFIIAGIIMIMTVIAPLIMIPLGLYFLRIGELKARWLECGNCGTRLESKRIKICPACGSRFN